MSELLRVIQVSVKSLFELYDHEFTLKSEDRITILHGPNGVGKTILLKCISALFNGHYSFLARTPFRSFSVTLSDKTHITISREKSGQPENPRGNKISRDPNFGFELTAEIRAKGQKQVVSIKQLADVNRLARIIEQESPFITQIEEARWLDRRTNRIFSSEELVEASPELLGSGRLARALDAEPEPLRSIRKRVKVYLIDTERLSSSLPDEQLLASGRRGSGSAVNNIASKLQRQIEATLAQYGRSAQQLDQSFPQRLIQDQTPQLELNELKRRMERLEERQRELSEIGLLERVPARPFDPDTLDNALPEKLGPMTLYLLDSEQKISSFDTVAGRLKLLVDSAKSKFKNKTLSIHRERGIQITSAKGDPLELGSLSSGEQHELVLMFELLFRTPPNSLILIDEPEISLHVAWQRLFLPELLSVAREIGFDVLIATHSPFIVGSRIDLMVGLDMDSDQLNAIQAIPNGAN